MRTDLHTHLGAEAETLPDTAAIAAAASAGLSDRDRTMLRLERLMLGRADKLAAIRRALGMRPTEYYQALNRLLETPAALAADPVTVNRLRRQRDTHPRVRRWLA